MFVVSTYLTDVTSNVKYSYSREKKKERAKERQTLIVLKLPKRQMKSGMDNVRQLSSYPVAPFLINARLDRELLHMQTQ